MPRTTITTITAAEAKAALKKWRAKAKANPKPPPYTDNQWNVAAIAYARWLVKRDGIVVPKDEAPSPVWTKHWEDGSKRIKAVIFGSARVVNEVWHPLDGAVVVELPHWDHVPVVHEELKERPVSALTDSGVAIRSAWYQRADRTHTGKLRPYDAWTRRQAAALKEATWLLDTYGPVPVALEASTEAAVQRRTALLEAA